MEHAVLESARPINRYFIVGSQKSGTTWLRDCLSCFVTFSKPEWYYPDLVAQIRDWIEIFGGSLDAAHRAELGARAARAAFEVILGEARGEKSAYPTVGNHMPLNADRYDNAINLLKQDIPKSKVILIVRDPRAVFNSLCFYLDRVRTGWSSELDVDEFADNWARQNRQWQASKPDAVMRYEDLKTAFVQTLANALTALDIGFTPLDIQSTYDSCYAIEKLRPNQPEIYRSGEILEWQSNLSEETSHRIINRASGVMESFGYTI